MEKHFFEFLHPTKEFFIPNSSISLETSKTSIKENDTFKGVFKIKLNEHLQNFFVIAVAQTKEYF